MPFHLRDGGEGGEEAAGGGRRTSLAAPGSSRLPESKTLSRGKSTKLVGAAGRPASPRGVRRTPTGGIGSPRGASGGKGAPLARGKSGSVHPAPAPAAAEAEETAKDDNAGIDFLKVRIRRDASMKREGPTPNMLSMSNAPSGMAEDDAVRVIQRAAANKARAQNHGFQAPSF